MMKLEAKPLGPPRIYMFLGLEGSANDDPPRLKCFHCKTEFIPSGPNHIYCSEECYIEHNGSDPEYEPDLCPCCEGNLIDRGTFSECDYCGYMDNY